MVVGKVDSLPELVPSLAVEMDGKPELLEIRKGRGGKVCAELDPGLGSKNDDSGRADIAMGVG